MFNSIYSFLLTLVSADQIIPTKIGTSFFDYLWTNIGNFFAGILVGIVEAFYAVCKWLLAFVDFLQYFIQKLIGLDYWLNNSSYTLSGATKSDLLFTFIFNDTVQKVFQTMIAVFIVLLIIFTIYQIIKNEWTYVTGKDFGNGTGNSKVGIMRSAIKAIVLVVIFPIMLIAGIISSNAILASLVKALNIDMSTTFGSTIFYISSQQANRHRLYAQNNTRIAISDTVNFYMIKDGNTWKYLKIVPGKSGSDNLCYYVSTFEEYSKILQNASIETKEYSVNSMFERVKPSTSNFMGYCISLNNDGTDYYFLVYCESDKKTDMYYYLHNVIQVPIMSKDDDIGSVEIQNELKGSMDNGVSSKGYVRGLSLNGYTQSSAIAKAAYNTWNYASAYLTTTSFEEGENFTTVTSSLLSNYGLGVSSAKFMINEDPISSYFDGGQIGLVQMQAEYQVMADVIDFMQNNGLTLYVIDITSDSIDWNYSGYSVDDKWLGTTSSGTASASIATNPVKPFNSTDSYLPFVISYSEDCLDTEYGNTLYLAKKGVGNELDGSKFIMCFKVQSGTSTKYIPLVNGKTYTDPLTKSTYNFSSDYYSSNYHGVVLAKGTFDTTTSQLSVGSPTYFTSSSSIEESTVSSTDPYYYDIVNDGSFSQYAVDNTNRSFTDYTVDSINVSSDDYSDVTIVASSDYDKTYQFVKDSATMSISDSIISNLNIVAKNSTGYPKSSSLLSDVSGITLTDNKKAYLFQTDDGNYFVVVADMTNNVFSLHGITTDGTGVKTDVIDMTNSIIVGETITTVTQEYYLKYDYKTSTNNTIQTIKPYEMTYSYTQDGVSVFETNDPIAISNDALGLKTNVKINAYFNTSSTSSLVGMFGLYESEDVDANPTGIQITFASSYGSSKKFEQIFLKFNLYSFTTFVNTSDYYYYVLKDDIENISNTTLKTNLKNYCTSNNVIDSSDADNYDYYIIKKEDYSSTYSSYLNKSYRYRYSSNTGDSDYYYKEYSIEPYDDDPNYVFTCKVNSVGFSWDDSSNSYGLYDGSRYVATIYKNIGTQCTSIDDIISTTTQVLYNYKTYYNINTQNKYTSKTAGENYYKSIEDNFVVASTRDNIAYGWFADLCVSITHFRLCVSLNSAYVDRISYSSAFKLSKGISFDYFFDDAPGAFEGNLTGKIGLSTFFVPTKISYWLIIVASILIIKVLGTSIWGVIKRFYEITLYFLAAPAVASTMPLDENKFTSAIIQPLISKVLSTYGVILGINVFFILLMPVKSMSNIFTAEDIATSGSYFLQHLPFNYKVLNLYVYILFMLVAFTMINSLPSMISGLIPGTSDKDNVLATGESTKKAAGKMVSDTVGTMSGAGLVKAAGTVKDAVTNSLPFQAGAWLKNRSEEKKNKKNDAENQAYAESLEGTEGTADDTSQRTDVDEEGNPTGGGDGPSGGGGAGANVEGMENAVSDVENAVQEQTGMTPSEAAQGSSTQSAIAEAIQTGTGEELEPEEASSLAESSYNQEALSNSDLVGNNSTAVMANVMKNSSDNDIVAKAMEQAVVNHNGGKAENVAGQMTADQKLQAIRGSMSKDEQEKFDKLSPDEQKQALNDYEVTSSQNENGELEFAVKKIRDENGNAITGETKKVDAETAKEITSSMVKSQNVGDEELSTAAKQTGAENAIKNLFGGNIALGMNMSSDSSSAQGGALDDLIMAMAKNDEDTKSEAILRKLDKDGNLEEFTKSMGISGADGNPATLNEILNDPKLYQTAISAVSNQAKASSDNMINKISDDEIGNELRETVQQGVASGKFKIDAWSLASEEAKQDKINQISEQYSNGTGNSIMNGATSHEKERIIANTAANIIADDKDGKIARELENTVFASQISDEEISKIDPNQLKMLTGKSDVKDLTDEDKALLGFMKTTGNDLQNIDMLTAASLKGQFNNNADARLEAYDRIDDAKKAEALASSENMALIEKAATIDPSIAAGRSEIAIAGLAAIKKGDISGQDLEELKQIYANVPLHEGDPSKVDFDKMDSDALYTFLLAVQGASNIVKSSLKEQGYDFAKVVNGNYEARSIRTDAEAKIEQEESLKLLNDDSRFNTFVNSQMIENHPEIADAIIADAKVDGFDAGKLADYVGGAENLQKFASAGFDAGSVEVAYKKAMLILGTNNAGDVDNSMLLEILQNGDDEKYNKNALKGLQQQGGESFEKAKENLESRLESDEKASLDAEAAANGYIGLDDAEQANLLESLANKDGNIQENARKLGMNMETYLASDAGKDDRAKLEAQAMGMSLYEINALQQGKTSSEAYQEISNQAKLSKIVDDVVANGDISSDNIREQLELETGSDAQAAFAKSYGQMVNVIDDKEAEAIRQNTKNRLRNKTDENGQVYTEEKLEIEADKAVEQENMARLARGGANRIAAIAGKVREDSKLMKNAKEQFNAENPSADFDSLSEMEQNQYLSEKFGDKLSKKDMKEANLEYMKSIGLTDSDVMSKTYIDKNGNEQHYNNLEDYLDQVNKGGKSLDAALANDGIVQTPTKPEDINAAIIKNMSNEEFGAVMKDVNGEHGQDSELISGLKHGFAERMVAQHTQEGIEDFKSDIGASDNDRDFVNSLLAESGMTKIDEKTGEAVALTYDDLKASGQLKFLTRDNQNENGEYIQRHIEDISPETMAKNLETLKNVRAGFHENEDPTEILKSKDKMDDLAKDARKNASSQALLSAAQGNNAFDSALRTAYEKATGNKYDENSDEAKTFALEHHDEIKAGLSEKDQTAIDEKYALNMLGGTENIAGLNMTNAKGEKITNAAMFVQNAKDHGLSIDEALANSGASGVKEAIEQKDLLVSKHKRLEEIGKEMGLEGDGSTGLVGGAKRAGHAIERGWGKFASAFVGKKGTRNETDEEIKERVTLGNDVVKQKIARKYMQETGKSFHNLSEKEQLAFARKNAASVVDSLGDKDKKDIEDAIEKQKKARDNGDASYKGVAVKKGGIVGKFNEFWAGKVETDANGNIAVGKHGKAIRSGGVAALFKGKATRDANGNIKIDEKTGKIERENGILKKATFAVGKGIAAGAAFTAKGIAKGAVASGLAIAHTFGGKYTKVNESDDEIRARVTQEKLAEAWVNNPKNKGKTVDDYKKLSKKEKEEFAKTHGNTTEFNKKAQAEIDRQKSLRDSGSSDYQGKKELKGSIWDKMHSAFAGSNVTDENGNIIVDEQTGEELRDGGLKGILFAGRIKRVDGKIMRDEHGKVIRDEAAGAKVLRQAKEKTVSAFVGDKVIRNETDSEIAGRITLENVETRQYLANIYGTDDKGRTFNQLSKKEQLAYARANSKVAIASIDNKSDREAIQNTIENQKKARDNGDASYRGVETRRGGLLGKVDDFFRGKADIENGKLSVDANGNVIHSGGAAAFFRGAAKRVDGKIVRDENGKVVRDISGARKAGRAVIGTKQTVTETDEQLRERMAAEVYAKQNGLDNKAGAKEYSKLTDHEKKYFELQNKQEINQKMGQVQKLSKEMRTGGAVQFAWGGIKKAGRITKTALVGDRAYRNETDDELAKRVYAETYEQQGKGNAEAFYDLSKKDQEDFINKCSQDKEVKDQIANKIAEQKSLRDSGSDEYLGIAMIRTTGSIWSKIGSAVRGEFQTTKNGNIIRGKNGYARIGGASGIWHGDAQTEGKGEDKHVVMDKDGNVVRSGGLAKIFKRGDVVRDKNGNIVRDSNNNIVRKRRVIGQILFGNESKSQKQVREANRAKMVEENESTAKSQYYAGPQSKTAQIIAKTRQKVYGTQVKADDAKVTQEIVGDSVQPNVSKMSAQEKKSFEYNRNLLQQQTRVDSQSSIISNLFRNTKLLNNEKIVQDMVRLQTGQKEITPDVMMSVLQSNAAFMAKVRQKAMADFGTTNISENQLNVTMKKMLSSVTTEDLKQGLSNETIGRYMKAHEKTKDQLLNLGAKNLNLSLDRGELDQRKLDAVSGSQTMQNQVVREMLNQELSDSRIRKEIKAMMQQNKGGNFNNIPKEQIDSYISAHLEELKTQLARVRYLNSSSSGGTEFNDITKALQTINKLSTTNNTFKTTLNQTITQSVAPQSRPSEEAVKKFFGRTQTPVESAPRTTAAQTPRVSGTPNVVTAARNHAQGKQVSSAVYRAPENPPKYSPAYYQWNDEVDRKIKQAEKRLGRYATMSDEKLKEEIERLKKQVINLQNDTTRSLSKHESIIQNSLKMSAMNSNFGRVLNRNFKATRSKTRSIESMIKLLETK
jgi:rhodanese-related sulfurtransferase